MAATAATAATGGRRLRSKRPALFLLANAVAALILLSCVFSFHFSAASEAIHTEQLVGLHSLTAVLQPWLSEGRDDLLHRFVGDADVVIHRSSFAASMEHALQANTTAGVCEDGRPALRGTPEHVCKPMVCLWSARLQRNVDLSFHGLADLPWEAHPKRCPEPLGAQTPAAVGQSPQVSIILLSGTSTKLAAQGLLEVFRTAREVNTAEIIVMDSTGGGDSRLLERAAARLVSSFGVRLRLLPVAPQTPMWAVIDEALHTAAAPYAAVVAAGTFVSHGWLHALVHTMELHPNAGVVGPVVLQQEQVVLEAGGLVYANGSVSLLGQDQMLNAELSSLRTVDFVSSACFMVRMRSWHAARAAREADSLSGLYADAAVLLSLAHEGYTTLVQPAALVFRQPELATQQAAADDEELRRVFWRRWQHLLSPAPACQTRPPLRGMWGRSSTKSLLWVDDVVPMPDNDSGSVRTTSLLKILVQAGYDVTFQPLLVWRRRYALALQMLGVKVLPLAKPGQWQLLNATGNCRYDGFVVARRTNYAIARMVIQEICPGIPQIFDTVDLHFMREARELTTRLAVPNITHAFDLVEWMDLKAPAMAETNQNISDLLGWRSQECELIRTADAAFLVSPDEIKVMEHYVPDSAPRLHLITNIHDDVMPTKRTTCRGREGLLFVGNYNHAPNREAVAFLLQDILPMIRKRLPPELGHLAHAHIVGAGKPTRAMQELLAANSDAATFYGYLPDEELQLLYSRVRVVIAPLLTGAGVKGKVNQAMKLGVPVVGTKIALEGMHPQDGVNCLVANSADGLAKHVVALYEDCVLWERLAEGGLENMQTHFSIETTRPAVLATFAAVGLGLPQQPECKLR